MRRLGFISGVTAAITATSTGLWKAAATRLPSISSTSINGLVLQHRFAVSYYHPLGFITDTYESHWYNGPIRIVETGPLMLEDGGAAFRAIETRSGPMSEGIPGMMPDSMPMFLREGSVFQRIREDVTHSKSS